MEDSFVVLVRQDDNEKFLFNRRMLVADIALARRFSGLTQAKHYFSKSIFTDERHQIVKIVHEEPPIDPKNPGAIVE